jgi:glutathione S-transferase
MRARLALRASGVAYEHREILLKNKPAHMLALSSQGTVPVLWLRHLKDQPVLSQSLDIMLWALRQHDPQAWLPTTSTQWTHTLARIASNDGPFKQHLDRYKYPQRSGLSDGLVDRDQAAQLLHALDADLQLAPYLSGSQWGLQDAALAPFVRQFAHVDAVWFGAQPWTALAAWLAQFEASEDFAAVMQKMPLWEPAATP